jgi:hypothetical protein
MVSLALRLHRNPMGRCVVLPTTRCIFKSGVPSEMAPMPGVVCRTHRPLPLLSLTCPVSREQYDDQAATRECGVVAARIVTPSVLLSTHGRTSGTAVCSRSLERLAPMCHSAKVVEGGP